MNTKNLDIVLNHYIDHFDELDDPNINDEGYKWRVESSFKKYWDIDAEDFPVMFRNAMSEIIKTNLINNSTIQPISGILKLFDEKSHNYHKEDIEFIREQFRMLLAEDGGDLDARGERVEAFLGKVNELIDKRFPGSWKYAQQRNSVIYYLNLWRPEDNYIFKATEANEWADCIEYADDFGSGASFSLRKYYKMCDELLEALNDYPQILELNQKRIEREAKGFDDHNHILVFDIIYCSSSKYMNFYLDCPTLDVTTKERVQIARRNEEIKQMEAQIEALNDEIESLRKTMVDIPNITGQIIKHKKYGSGVITEVFGDNFEAQFSDKNSKFPLTSISGGFINVEDSKLEEDLKHNGEVTKQIETIDKELGKLTRKLESM